MREIESGVTCDEDPDSRVPLEGALKARKPSFGGCEGAVSTENAQDAPSYEKTKAKVERLCVQRDQNSLLLKQRLLREGFDESFVEASISRAVEVGLIDDLRWAEMIVRSRLSAGKGIAGIRRELASGGVEIESLPEWPEGYSLDESSERQRALEILQKRPPKAKNKRAAAYRRLVTKGFSSSVAQSVSREWHESLPKESL